MRRPRILAPLLAFTLCFLASGATAGARVPPGFVGVNLGSYAFEPALNPPQQFGRMARSGVESVRVVFSWSQAQPYASWADVPASRTAEFQSGVGNVPTSFAATDQMMTLAAGHGLKVMPMVIGTPDWEAMPHPPSVFGLPRSNTTYADYVETVVRRYGPQGAFWSANPGLPYVPVQMWQIWNEPNTRTRWQIQPFARTYLTLLKAAGDAIHRADRTAKVVLAGLPNYSWLDLAKIYRVPGARRLFDVVAIHPYTAAPAGVITLLQRARAVMNRFGDAHKSMLASETGWPSSLGHSPEHYPFDSTEAGQARKIAALLPMLAAHRQELGLLGFDIYTWLDTNSGHSFSYSGLLRFRGTRIIDKPAIGAFRRAALALEGCRVKAAVATRCERS